MYAQGKDGVQKDIKKALHYYEVAAEKGYVPALCALGEMYEQGEEVEKNDWKALSYYKEAERLQYGCIRFEKSYFDREKDTDNYDLQRIENAEQPKKMVKNRVSIIS